MPRNVESFHLIPDQNTHHILFLFMRDKPSAIATFDGNANDNGDEREHPSYIWRTGGEEDEWVSWRGWLREKQPHEG